MPVAMYRRTRIIETQDATVTIHVRLYSQTKTQLQTPRTEVPTSRPRKTTKRTTKHRHSQINAPKIGTKTARAQIKIHKRIMIRLTKTCPSYSQKRIHRNKRRNKMINLSKIWHSCKSPNLSSRLLMLEQCFKHSFYHSCISAKVVFVDKSWRISPLNSLSDRGNRTFNIDGK